MNGIDGLVEQIDFILEKGQFMSQGDVNNLKKKFTFTKDSKFEVLTKVLEKVFPAAFPQTFTVKKDGGLKTEMRPGGIHGQKFV